MQAQITSSEQQKKVPYLKWLKMLMN